MELSVFLAEVVRPLGILCAYGIAVTGGVALIT